MSRLTDLGTGVDALIQQGWHLTEGQPTGRAAGDGVDVHDALEVTRWYHAQRLEITRPKRAKVGFLRSCRPSC